MKGKSMHQRPILSVATKVCAVALTVIALTAMANDKPVPVTVKNFDRAESDLFFGKSVKGGAFGKLNHEREMSSIAKLSSDSNV